MSEHITHETISDSERLGVVLEHLKYIEEQFRSLEANEDASESLRVSTYSTGEELIDLLEDKGISVSGTMMIPTLDESGHVTGAAQANGTLHDCELSGVSVLGEHLSSEFPRGTVVLQFTYGSRSISSYTEQTDIAYKAIFPVSDCSLHVVDELDDILATLTPDDDDEIAADIDSALHNGSIDLAALADIVTTQFPALTDLQREMYYSYLDRTGNMNNPEVILSVAACTIYGLSDDTYNQVMFEHPHDISGVFLGYTIDVVEDDEQNTQYLLGVSLEVPELGGTVQAHVQDINEFLFV